MCVYNHRLLPAPLGTFSHLLLSISSFVFCNRGGEKTTPRLANSRALKTGTMRAHDGSGSQLSWRTVGHLCHPSKARGPLWKKGGGKNVRAGRGVECCDCHGRQATAGVQCCAPLQKIILAGLGGPFPSSQQGGEGLGTVT